MANPIRSELETRLQAFANSYSPALAIAWEGVAFTKPSPAVPFLQPTLTSSSTINVTTDGTRIRILGNFMVNVWCPDNKGSKTNDDISSALVSAFPIVPKTGNVSIEQTPNSSQAVVDSSGWRITPVTIKYRYEGYA